MRFLRRKSARVLQSRPQSPVISDNSIGCRFREGITGRSTGLIYPGLMLCVGPSGSGSSISSISVVSSTLTTSSGNCSETGRSTAVRELFRLERTHRIMPMPITLPIMRQNSMKKVAQTHPLRTYLCQVLQKWKRI